MSRRRVVVSGLGAVTPAGPDVASTWQALLAGRSAVRRSARLVEAACRSQVAAEVPGFEPDHRLGRASALALAAAREAWRDARLDGAGLDGARAGVILGTGFGDAAETARQTEAFLFEGARGVSPRWVVRAMANAPVAHVALALGLRGPSFVTGSACAAAAHAVAMGARLIERGDADVVLAGGAEEISSVLAVAAFDALRALSTRNAEPERASRPFERDRDGFVLGEGAAVVVLEERAHAVRRGARVHAEIAGIGLTGEAHHLTAPDPEGEAAARAMTLALADARRGAGDVGYVNAHGTSTRLNDVAETRALRRALGPRAARVPVSATKSMLGHLLGASAAVGLLAAVLTVRDGVAHPTINYEAADPECDLDVVPNAARRIDAELALVNAFAFGGHCVSIAVARA